MFQAFEECLHNVALIGNKILTDFFQETARKQGFKQETRGQL